MILILSIVALIFAALSAQQAYKKCVYRKKFHAELDEHARTIEVLMNDKPMEAIRLLWDSPKRS